MVGGPINIRYSKINETLEYANSYENCHLITVTICTLPPFKFKFVCMQPNSLLK